LAVALFLEEIHHGAKDVASEECFGTFSVFAAISDIAPEWKRFSNAGTRNRQPRITYGATPIAQTNRCCNSHVAQSRSP
jgi:hypothetical protein